MTYNSTLIRPPLRTVTGWENDSNYSSYSGDSQKSTLIFRKPSNPYARLSEQQGSRLSRQVIGQVGRVVRGVDEAEPERCLDNVMNTIVRIIPRIKITLLLIVLCLILSLIIGISILFLRQVRFLVLSLLVWKQLLATSLAFLRSVAKVPYGSKLSNGTVPYGWLSKLWSLLGALNMRCRIIVGIQKGTIILTTTHM